MIRLYGKYWWSFFVRGVIAIMLGLAAIMLPGITLELLAILLAAFFIADGVFSLAASIGGKKLDSRWWLLLLEGLAGILIGVFTIIWPALTVLILVIFVGFWALLTGILEITAAVKLRHEIQGEWLLALSGIISILFGLIMFVSPGAGAVALVWIIGAYALFFGISLILLGLKLRKHQIAINF